MKVWKGGLRIGKPVRSSQWPRRLNWRSLILCVALVPILLMLSACKIQITVPEGGSVESQSGALNCATGQVCEVEVTDVFFDENFLAVPAPGFRFTGWKRADRFFCGDSIQPCRLFTAEFSGNEALLAFLASDDRFFLEPTFARDTATSTSADTLFVSGSGQLFSDDVVAVDPGTGSTLAGFSTGLFQGLADLEFVDGQLFGIESSGSGLFRVDFGAGTQTKIGNTGVVVASASLFTVPDELYLVDDLRSVYRINRDTGFAAPLGFRIRSQVVTGAPDATVYVLEETLRDIDLHTIDLATGAIVSTQSIPFQTTGDIVDIAFTKDGLIAVTLFGTLIQVDIDRGSATPYAAVNSGLLTIQGMTAGRR